MAKMITERRLVLPEGFGSGRVTVKDLKEALATHSDDDEVQLDNLWGQDTDLIVIHHRPENKEEREARQRRGDKDRTRRMAALLKRRADLDKKIKELDE